MAAYRQFGRLRKMEMLLLFPKLWSWKKAATITMANERQLMRDYSNWGLENNKSIVHLLAPSYLILLLMQKVKST